MIKFIHKYLWKNLPFNLKKILHDSLPKKIKSKLKKM